MSKRKHIFTRYPKLTKFGRESCVIIGFLYTMVGIVAMMLAGLYTILLAPSGWIFIVWAAGVAVIAILLLVFGRFEDG